MSDRPVLNKHLDGDTFRSYYYLKEELTAFCRQNGIPASGGKLELFLHSFKVRMARLPGTSGEISSASKKPKTKPVYTEITEDTLIEPNFVCSEVHRAFFQSRIGSGFTFLVPFQKWLKTNTGKTYQQAIEAYFQIQQDKKKGRTAIDRQFEYNTYIRDFYAENTGKSLEDAIKCWKYKKSLRGHNRYEKSDLNIL